MQRIYPKKSAARISILNGRISTTPVPTRLTTVWVKALIAKTKWVRKKLIAETGAGQHGVAPCHGRKPLVGLDCDIYMGEIDIKKEHPNVV